jgi:hypothetical protein
VLDSFAGFLGKCGIGLTRIHLDVVSVLASGGSQLQQVFAKTAAELAHTQMNPDAHPLPERKLAI